MEICYWNLGWHRVLGSEARWFTKGTKSVTQQGKGWLYQRPFFILKTYWAVNSLNHYMAILGFAVHILSQFMTKPHIPYLEAAQRVLHYVKNTYGQCIYRSSTSSLQLMHFVMQIGLNVKTHGDQLQVIVFFLGNHSSLEKPKNRPLTLIQVQK